MSTDERHDQGVMLNASDSQTTHREHFANMFLLAGNAIFDAVVKKWRVQQSRSNYPAMLKLMEDIAAQYGDTFKEVESAAHTYLVAARNQELMQQEARTQAQIDALNAKGTQKAKAKAKKLQKFMGRVHATPQQIAAGLQLAQARPEITQIADMWTEIRDNTVKVMVQSGMLNRETAEDYMDRAAYVPFYREGQVEAGAGPRDYISKYVTAGLNKRLKGSDKPVANTFENMVRWTTFNIEAALGNDTARRMIDELEAAGLAQKVPVIPAAQRNKGVEVYQNGEKQAYLVEDPLMLDAFAGLGEAGPALIGIAAKAAEVLRKTVTLNPVFSIGQVFQDAFGAMMTSGLPPHQALRIPLETFKEFTKTLAGTSETHRELRKYAAVGELAYNSNYARDDFEQRMQNLKPETQKFISKIGGKLEYLSMASDNAVRQAIYNLTVANGESRGVAIERAFEIINFRRQGSAAWLPAFARMIPFMNAYLQSLNVSSKMIAGTGIAPGKSRAENHKTLMLNFATLGVLNLAYAMMVGGDDEYEEMDPRVRDRGYYIPPWNVTIPLRADITLLPKLLAEHTYRIATDAATEDPRIFKNSIRDAFANTVLGPTMVPQIVKPTLEWGLNYSFWTGRPLVGPSLQRLEPGRQIDLNTSELSRLIGEHLNVSPVKLDSWIQGTFGSLGGLVLMASNTMAVINGARPTQNKQDFFNSVPGLGRFVPKEQGGGLRSMFYEAAKEIDRTYVTYLDMLANDMDSVDAYLEKDSTMARIATAKGMRQLQNELGKIRSQIRTLTAMRDDSPDVRRDMINELREIERMILQSIDLKQIRAETL